MDEKVIQNMPVDRIACDPQLRGRFDEESLVGLAQSIRESGVLVPLLVRRDADRFVVLEGERRLRAARRAGLTTVPVIVDDQSLSPLDVMLRQLVVNSQRQDLTPIERARAFSTLMEQSGWTGAEVARRTGFSEATISRLTALLTLPEDVVERIDAGEIPASTAYQIAIAGNADEQSRLAEVAASGRMSRDRVVERTRQARRATRPRRSRRPAHERVRVHLGPGCSLAVSGPNLTLTLLTEWLQVLLKRIGALEPQDMALAEAVKALAADASNKGVVS